MSKGGGEEERMGRKKDERLVAKRKGMYVGYEDTNHDCLSNQHNDLVLHRS